MKSFSELLERIQNTRTRLGISKHPAWYRGHSSVDYKLLPSLLRRKNGIKHERNLYALFKTKAGTMLPANLKSWMILAIMQHHGVPTRLLDWSESLDVALFFAICEDRPNPCIWVLNPYRLNYHSVQQNIIFDDADPLPFDYYQTVLAGAWPHTHPIAIAAPWMDERIRKQKGCFTLHGADNRTLDELTKDTVKCVPIPTHLIEEIRRYFRQKDFDYFDVYPDLPGLALSLVRQFRLNG